MRPEAFFLPATEGHRFCLYTPAVDREKGLLIYLHPLAEEMNHSRRMIALQAGALAGIGYAVLQIDLFGCGDSAGDFGDAGWGDWLDDVQLAYRWARQRSTAPITLWGLRAGCLLACEASPTLPEPVDFLFWQPQLSGAQALQQFLRLAAAAAILDGGGKGIVAGLRSEIEAGRPVEVGGYQLSPELARGLEAAVLAPPADSGRRVRWFEVSQRDGAALSPAVGEACRRWQEAGHEVSATTLSGPAFWQTPTAGLTTELLAVTRDGLEAGDGLR